MNVFFIPVGAYLKLKYPEGSAVLTVFLVNMVNIFLVVEQFMPIKNTEDAEQEGSVCMSAEKRIFWPRVVPTFLLWVH